MHYLNNRFIDIQINSKGAELTSVKLIENSIEYLWQADPVYWERHSPVLFPIVGKLKNNSYQYNGKTFKLGQHGFGCDHEFELLEKSDNSALFMLKSNKYTLPVYPFAFELYIRYRLNYNVLEIQYTVKNIDDKNIYFSIGAHPGFNCPLLLNENMEDYYLEFETEETIGRLILDNCLISGYEESFLNNTKKLFLSMDLFKNDAIIFKGLKSNTISIKSNKNCRAIKMKFKGFPYMGIWSKSIGASFICLEPWFGVADSKNTNGRLEDKEGIINLPPSLEFSCNFSIEIS